MIEFIRRRLGVKLFLSYLAVIMIGVLILGVATEFTVPTAFNRHLGMMDQMMGNGGMTMGAGPGGGAGPGYGQGNGYGSELYQNFRASFGEALVLAALAAMAVALVVSLIFSGSVVAPVRAMMTASRRIAEGHYDERVQGGRSDELGQLAHSFNQMAGQLEQVEARRRQLIGDITHELRTPLTAIKGSMEGLMDGVLPASLETYQQVHQEADRLSRLVDDLQELSRVEAGAYEMDLRPADISVLVGTVVKRLGYQFDEKRVGLRASLSPDLPRVLADNDRIIQVLTNLVGNALHYTPAGGEVTIRAERQGGEVHVTVEDTGIGIPPEHLPHIFTRFYRVDKSRSRHAGGGSGIGLTVARHLVEAHGGRIWAESEGRGRGSAFTFTLPVAG
ncbi:MAG: HAMP domain-containing protein [Chloroflexi bacterium]|nr:HAMP domain-containing protein [Chloroflexota bacterium]